MYQPIIITDLDNTLYNWVDFYAPSFRGMVHAVSKKIKIQEDILIKDFKRIFAKYKNLEFSFSIQELEICKNMTEEEIKEIVDLGKLVFSKLRSSHLKTYEGVKETLYWCKNNGIKVIGVTNSPLFHAKMRLKQLYIDQLIYGLAGWQGFDIENNIYTKEIHNKLAGGYYSTKLKYEWSFPIEQIKPSPIPYLYIINELKASHKETYVIGDSISKDLKPAAEIGANTIWAKYGLNFSNKNFDTLLKITHWDDKKISSTYEDNSITPNYIIDSFEQIKSIVQKPQLTLF